MSYCRWSSQNSMCDVYVFEHVDGGITTYVAGRRRAQPSPDYPETADKTLWAEYQKKHDEWEALPLIDIGLSQDGAERHGQSRVDAVAWLRELKQAGYNVPDYAIEKLELEIKDGLE